MADGIDTNEQSSKTMIQFKALFNEIYLDDIKQKTKRGQEGLVRQGLVFSQLRLYVYSNT
jgi:DNA invertase Pin-like site-specific DNA recombinase